MKNIHVLPTDNPSRLVLNSINNDLFLTTTKKFPSDIMKFKNICITDDSEIKVGDWCLCSENLIHKVIEIKSNIGIIRFQDGITEVLKACKKIILTDNKDLIKDGVQAIDDEFLEWFVKNPSCEWVEVEKGYLGMGVFCKSDKIISKDKIHYKIIIPKEEPKKDLEKEMFELEQELDIPSHLRWHNSKSKQETLEEFAKRRFNEERLNTYTHYNIEDAIKEGTKWQQERMYSEKEVSELVDMLQKCKEYFLLKTDLKSEERADAIGQVLEQFKKK